MLAVISIRGFDKNGSPQEARIFLDLLRQWVLNGNCAPKE